MRGQSDQGLARPRTRLGLAVLLSVAAMGCPPSSSDPAGPRSDPTDSASPAELRAKRRAFDGAPPVKPHGELGMACTECHNERGVEVADLGYAPPSPHEATPGLSSLSNCRQCHVERRTEEEFRSSRFEGAQQDLRPGKTAFVGAPPVMPHSAFMRENCLACHSGPAARAGIRTSHPERTRCRQCHLEQVVDTLFRSGSKHSEGPGG